MILLAMFFCILQLCGLVTPLLGNLQWDYTIYGPSQWHQTYPECGGSMQSPVDIELASVWFDRKLLAFDMPRYDSIPRNAQWELQNTGYSVRVLLNGEYILSEGGLDGSYKAAYMEFRWGEKHLGSEHTIDGTQYAMECHVVHYSLKHGSFDEAMQEPEGIAILSFMFKVLKFDNPSYKHIIKALQNVTHKGDHINLRPIPFLSLLPVNLNDYYRYHGSRTQPPCTENVLWTIFKDQIHISDKQLGIFQKYILSSQPDDEAHVKLKSNWRPTQPLNGRTIYSSDPDDATIFSHPLGSPMSITMAVFLGMVLLLLFTRTADGT